MNTFARIIARCFFASLLLSPGFAFADRPAMDPEGTPLPPPGSMSETTGIDTDTSSSRPGATAEPDNNFEPEASAQPKPAPEAPAKKPMTTTVETKTGDAVDIKPGETLGIEHLNFPRRGMSMDQVKGKLGQPVKVDPAVGKPPITRWIYNDRTVYFERSTVIHVVATK
jgi:hypothetical protein